jgi:Lipid A 3-O-deacylase (PagL)
MNCLDRGVLLCLALSCTAAIFAQDVPQSDTFSRKNTFTLFAEYSNTSSHILMGDSRQRKLADFGGAYTRRVLRFSGSDLSYQIEVRPVVFESDPIEIVTETTTIDSPPPTGTQTFTGTLTSATTGKCAASSSSIQFPAEPGLPAETIADTIVCGRQWTFGQSFSPIGFKYSMRTHHPLQPFIIATLGYMYTSRPVPVSTAESFNFVFDFGAGIELFRSEQKKRSVAIEARFHHFSNRDTAESNPGADNILYNLSYSFGR